MVSDLEQRLALVQLGAWYSVDGEQPKEIETTEEVENVRRMIREEFDGGEPAPQVWATLEEAEAAINATFVHFSRSDVGSKPLTIDCVDCRSPIDIGDPDDQESMVYCSQCGAKFEIFGDESDDVLSFYLERVRRPDAEEGE